MHYTEVIIRIGHSPYFFHPIQEFRLDAGNASRPDGRINGRVVGDFG